MTDNNSNEKWFQHALQQAPWRTETQTTSLVLAVVVLVAVIGALYLAQASRTAGAGRRLQTLETERQRLEQQNAQLRAEIAAQRSVPRLIAEAQALGYHPARSTDVEYLVVEDVPPLAPPTPTASPQVAEVVPVYDESLEGWLADQLVTFRIGFAEFWQKTFGGDTRTIDEELLPTPTAIPEQLFESFPELAPTLSPTGTPEAPAEEPPAEEAAPDA